MAVDPQAKKVTINFPGGAMTATLGLLEAIFGATQLQQLTQPDAPKTVSVTAHSRRRVIGQPPTAVAAFSYVKQDFGSAVEVGTAGGEAMAMILNGEEWTARLSGSHQSLAAFLAGRQGGGALFVKSQKGRSYGPF